MHVTQEYFSEIDKQTRGWISMRRIEFFLVNTLSVLGVSAFRNQPLIVFLQYWVICEYLYLVYSAHVDISIDLF